MYVCNYDTFYPRLNINHRSLHLRMYAYYVLHTLPHTHARKYLCIHETKMRRFLQKVVQPKNTTSSPLLSYTICTICISRLSSYVRKSGGHYDLQHALTNLLTFTHMYRKIKLTVSEQLLKKLLLTNPCRVLYSNLQHAAE